MNYVKIRDLKVMTMDGQKDAQLYKDNWGKVFYAENDRILFPYNEIGHCYGCESCVNCIDNAIKTNNNAYYCKPLPNVVKKCSIIEQRYKDYDYDITISNSNTCRYFQLNEKRNIGDKTNINHFIDYENSCFDPRNIDQIIKFPYIKGISYKGRQAPFTFRIDKYNWFDMNFIDIKNNRVKMYCPTRWDYFNRNSIEYRGVDNYLKMYGLPNGMTKKQFKKEWDVLGCANIFSVRWFNFDTMWFDEVVIETDYMDK